jgi:hypothetical protein
VKWEQEVYIDRNRVKNNMEKGYKYLVKENNPQPYDVDSDNDDYLYSLLTDELKDIKSYFHVGFSMGRTLVSMHRLRPDIDIGGLTWFDTSVAYGQQLFNLSDHNFKIQIGEYPYKPIVGEWDFINLGRLPHKSNLGREIMAKACEDAGKYVFFFANPGQEYVVPDGFEVLQDFDSGLEFTPCLLTRKEVEDPIMDEDASPPTELGKKKRGDYYKFIDFPVEITEPIEIITEDEVDDTNGK